MRRTGFAFAVGILVFSALAAANPTENTAIGELSTSQIEDELQVHKPILTIDSQLINLI